MSLVVCIDSEVKLSIASFLSDRIVDEILQSLSRSQHTLVSVSSTCLLAFHFLLAYFFLVIPHAFSVYFQADHLIKKDHPLVHQEPHLETELLDEMILQPEKHEQDLKQDWGQENDLDDMDSMVGKHQHE